MTRNPLPRQAGTLLRIALADKARQARRQLPVSPQLGLLYAAIEKFGSGPEARAKEKEQLLTLLVKVAQEVPHHVRNDQ